MRRAPPKLKGVIAGARQAVCQSPSPRENVMAGPSSRPPIDTDPARFTRASAARTLRTHAFMGGRDKSPAMTFKRREFCTITPTVNRHFPYPTGVHSTCSIRLAPVASITSRSKPSATPLAGGITASAASRSSSIG